MKRTPMNRLNRLTGFALVATLALTGCDYDDGTPTYDNTLPDNGYCNPVSNWDDAWVYWENQVVTLINAERAAGATCGGEAFGSAPPLAVSPELRCASRVHSKDMHDREYFDHTNLDGEGPSARFDKAGWEGRGWGENIIAGYGSPEAMVQGWMDSPGHCRNIMKASFTHIGLGYFYGSKGYGHYATSGFGTQ